MGLLLHLLETIANFNNDTYCHPFFLLVLERVNFETGSKTQIFRTQILIAGNMDARGCILHNVGGCQLLVCVIFDKKFS